MEPRIISFKPKANCTQFGCFDTVKDTSPSMEHNIALISTPILVNDLHISPPTFSRLPPDGHEFPPNFTEPLIITPVLKQNGSNSSSNNNNNNTTTVHNNKINNNHSINNGLRNNVKLAKDDNIDKISYKEDAPPLPKTVPPSTVPRKIYRQDLIITVDDTRFEPATENTTIHLDTNDSNAKKSTNWHPGALEDKVVRKEIMITAKNGHLPSDNNNSMTTIEARRRSIENSDAFKKFDVPRKQIGQLPTNWRKDEKSEKSVRDKIAMFSNEDVTDKPILGPRKSLNKSTENLLSDNYVRSRKISDSVGNVSLSKKAQSVENLDDICRTNTSLLIESNGRLTTTTDYSSPPQLQYKSKQLGKAFSVENLNNNSMTQKSEIILTPEPDKYSNYASTLSIPSSYASLPRTKPPSVARTTSFSGQSNGGNSNYDDRRRSSINNLLEQRKKSMSKLRGLIIPEKTALGEVAASPIVFDLPEIQNKDAQKVLLSSTPSSPITNANNLCGYTNSSTRREPVVPNPRHYTPAYQSLTTPTENSYKSIFSSNRPLSSIARSSETKALFNKKNVSAQVLPPVKPPRTSLILASRSSNDSQKSLMDDSEDSDSVFSSKISSPPNSPVTTAPPEKFALTRTFSNETNTSIASSTTSTLTSGSGSQASCSSVGSTPTIDMSRKILKSSSSESYVNRKNILALAKCRSGKDESFTLNGRPQRRYDDEDSTDGYDEEETRRIPKAKQRTSMVAISKPPSNDIDNGPINYRLVTSDDNLVDMVINVASYVEVTSDTDGDSKTSDSMAQINTKFIDEERRASFKAPAQKPTIRSSAKVQSQPDTTKSSLARVQEKLSESTDLAKWVRNEVAKSLKSEADLKAATEKTRIKTSKVTAKVSVSESIQKFNQSSNKEQPKLPLSIQAKPASVPIPTESHTRSSEIRKAFDLKVSINNNNTTSSPVKSPKGVTYNHHERFSSLDSLASSSSGVSSSQTSNGILNNTSDSLTHLQGTPTDFGSFSSYGSNHNLMTQTDLQIIIEEADPPLKTPEAFVVVLQRDSPECSVGVTLAGGADYEAKEITIHRILSNSPAYKDGRLRKGDRILSINGLSMRGLTHRESVTVLKTPRSEVVMVVTRSESMPSDCLNKSLRQSLGSMSSLNEKINSATDMNNRKNYHKSSRSLDLDAVSNEESLNDESKSTDGAEESTASSMGDDAVFGLTENGTIHNGMIKDGKSINETAKSAKKIDGVSKQRIVEILKDSCGLGLAIEGGMDSPTGHRPLTVKKVFMGGAAEKTGVVSVGDAILSINDFNTENMTRVQAWNYMKGLPSGPVKFIFL